MVWHELWYGCYRLPPSAKRTLIEAYLKDVIARTIPILPYDQRAALWHAKERARLTLIGRMPPFADGQIAAVAATNGLGLYIQPRRLFCFSRPATGGLARDLRVGNQMPEFGTFGGLKIVRQPLGPTQVRDHCPVDETGRHTKGARQAAMQRPRPADRTSARGRITGCSSWHAQIADLATSERIQPAHIAEAIHLRSAATDGVGCGACIKEFRYGGNSRDVSVDTQQGRVGVA